MALSNKYNTGFVPLIILVFFFIMANSVFAETKVFVEEYSYQASEADSKLSSRVIALEQVKRLLLEKLGTYLESETEVKNFQLTKDQIVILTAGLVRAEIINERWDGKTYFLKAKITADPKDVTNSINKLRHDRQETKELEETRRRADEALREVQRLREELEIAKSGKVKQDQYQKAINGVSAIDWFEQGNALKGSEKYQEAIEACSRSSELDPKYAKAYFARGYVYDNLGNHFQAIRNYDKAISISPNYAMAYYNRGCAYGKLGDLQQKIEDYKIAAELGYKPAQDFLKSKAIRW